MSRPTKHISAKHRDALARFFAPLAHDARTPTFAAPVSVLPIDNKPHAAPPARPVSVCPPAGQEELADGREKESQGQDQDQAREVTRE